MGVWHCLVEPYKRIKILLGRLVIQVSLPLDFSKLLGLVQSYTAFGDDYCRTQQFGKLFRYLVVSINAPLNSSILRLLLL